MILAVPKILALKKRGTTFINAGASRQFNPAKSSFSEKECNF